MKIFKKIISNMLKLIGQLPQGDSGKVLSDFSDAGKFNLAVHLKTLGQ